MGPPIWILVLGPLAVYSSTTVYIWLEKDANNIVIFNLVNPVFTNSLIFIVFYKFLFCFVFDMFVCNVEQNWCYAHQDKFIFFRIRKKAKNTKSQIYQKPENKKKYAQKQSVY